MAPTDKPQGISNRERTLVLVQLEAFGQIMKVPQIQLALILDKARKAMEPRP